MQHSKTPWEAEGCLMSQPNRHYLLLGISGPQPGAGLHVLLVHMPFTAPRLPPFPLPSLSSLPHHVSPAEGNAVNPACAKGRESRGGAAR